MKSIIIPLAIASLLSVACKPEKAGTAAVTEGTAATASAVKPYPLDVCLVSDEKLGEMGDPVIYIHEGQQIKFCCDKCLPKFKKDPAKYLSKMK